MTPAARRSLPNPRTFDSRIMGTAKRQSKTAGGTEGASSLFPPSRRYYSQGNAPWLRPLEMGDAIGRRPEGGGGFYYS